MNGKFYITNFEKHTHRQSLLYAWVMFLKTTLTILGITKLFMIQLSVTRWRYVPRASSLENCIRRGESACNELLITRIKCAYCFLCITETYATEMSDITVTLREIDPKVPSANSRSPAHSAARYWQLGWARLG